MRGEPVMVRPKYPERGVELSVIDPSSGQLAVWLKADSQKFFASFKFSVLHSR
jgi:hypothetical protein